MKNTFDASDNWLKPVWDYSVINYARICLVDVWIIRPMSINQINPNHKILGGVVEAACGVALGDAFATLIS